MKMGRLGVVSALSLFAAAGAAMAQETVYGFINNAAAPGHTLVSFGSNNPGGASVVGLMTGLAQGHTLRGIDFRPNGGALYALSADATNANAQVYTVDITTGAMTPVGASFALTNNTGGRISIDFNPAADRLRIMSNSGHSYRWNPNTSAFVAEDTRVAWDAGDPNGPGNPAIIGIAYDNNTSPSASTTLYAWDFDTDALFRIGGVGGTPSPNGGVATTIFTPGAFVTSSGAFGFDISGATGTAYISWDNFATPGTFRFGSVDLTTGALTDLGAFQFQIQDISVLIPAPGAAGLIGLAGIAAIRRRR